MKNFFSKFILFFVIVIVAGVAGGFMVIPALAASSVNLSAGSSDLQTQIDEANQQIEALNQKIADYQTKLNQAGADKKTLQTAIKTLDLQRSKVETQVAVIQKQIDATKLQIKQLGNKIKSTKQTIAMYQDGIAKALRDYYDQSGNRSLAVQLLSEGGLSHLWQSISGILQVQNAFHEKTEELKAAETDLASTQSAVQQKESALSAQNKSLASQQQALNATVKSKSQLLAETKSKESTYQKLLAQAEAELKSYSNFTKNAGGAKLLANQTVCDSWGCYYNQRDTSWGNDSLNGTGYTIASDGCLVTSMAMVITHYGHRDVTPVSINSNPDNFAAYFPAYLLYTVNAGGVTATRVTASIDAVLATGNPVIVGMKVYGGTHFIVLVSGSKGGYIMRDPYVAAGKDIDFSSYYNLKEIYSITKVVISS